MKKIKYLLFLILLFISSISKAAVSISSFRIDSQYILNGKLYPATGGVPTQFLAYFDLIKAGTTYNTVKASIVLIDSGIQTVLSEVISHYDGDWGSMTTWSGSITGSLPAGKLTGNIYLQISLYEGNTKGATANSTVSYGIYTAPTSGGINTTPTVFPLSESAGGIPVIGFYRGSTKQFYYSRHPTVDPAGYGFLGFLGYGVEAGTSGSTPLYMYIKGGEEDNLYTTNRQSYTGYQENSAVVNVFLTQVPGSKPIYSHYNSTIDRHRLTNQPGVISGYNFEDVKFYMYQNKQLTTHPLPEADCEELYEYYNYTDNDHFYTTVRSADSQWVYERTLGYVSTIQKNNTIPLYRYWNGVIQDHYYTTTKANYGDYAYEGITGYVYGQSQTGTVPIYSHYSPSLQDHYYSTVGTNISGYTNEGIKFYMLIYPY